MLTNPQYTRSGARVEKIYEVGTTPPEDTRLFWIDTSVNPNILKYSDGTNWLPVPVNYSVYAAGTTAPADTRLLWLDTTANTGGLKRHNGSSWVAVPVLYT